MKRLGAWLLCAALAVLLSACGKAPAPQMYIEAAQLTEQEQNIADLLDEAPTDYNMTFLWMIKFPASISAFMS